jgi:hypothetical protein
VTRRFTLLVLAIVASLSVIVAACGSTAPAAPALTDPKEILSTSVLSVKDVKTLEITGSFTGSVKAAQLGDIDLSTVKLSASIDIPNKKAKVSLDAPSILGTKVDALLLDKVAYYKVAGPLAAFLGASADKYTKADVPTASGNPAANLTDVAASVAQLKAALDKLPTPPTKAADEKCGDQDCYHVVLKLTGADLKALDPTSSTNGDVSLDLWSRKSDNRPAKLAFAVTTVDMGTFGVTLDIKYDVPVSVDAPPADQVVTP